MKINLSQWAESLNYPTMKNQQSDSDSEQKNISFFTQVYNPSPALTMSLNETYFMDFLDPRADDSWTYWSGAASKQDPEQELNAILRYLVTGVDPEFKTKQAQETFKNKAGQFYLQGVHMYRRRQGSPSQVVIFNKKRRKAILWEMHEGQAHHGVWAVAKQTTLRYYWPSMQGDIKQHIGSCHTCQIRSTKKMHIPVTISNPQRLFSKVYLDVMKMPKARGKEWLVACRDDLSGATECKALKYDRAKAIAKFFYHRIILRYGTVMEVVTDNGPSFQKDFKEMLSEFGIKQITISPYNSQANGVVERGHFNIREALVKLCKGNLSQWPLMVPAACYADRITIRRATGFSPFYLLHGVHPFLPCDLADATFMVTDFKPGMTDEELLAARIRQVLRMPQDVERARNILKQSRVRSKEIYDTKYARRLHKENYEPGALVLLRNNPIENSVSIERKTANRYMGPYQVVRRTQGGSYVLQELNGNMLRHTVAAFRLIPYLQRKDLEELDQNQDSDVLESNSVPEKPDSDPEATGLVMETPSKSETENSEE